GGAQDACRQQYRIIELQAAGMNGKGWHEKDDLPGKIKGLLIVLIVGKLDRSLRLIEISNAENDSAGLFGGFMAMRCLFSLLWDGSP
ncbi:MAG: hypothetical protein PHN61_05635, partial [Methanothrix sp.]|nr:hypothetical protein [Methanothrix sp.]